MGWQPVAFSEIEKFPSAVLAHHYPSVPNWGDMTKFKEWPDANIDVLVGGTPCQSFSVAGLRKGLDDPRGNLMLTFGAIAQRYRPKWLVWENVPGVLSSNGGRDFGAFLGMLAELGYGFAYRVLDAQYFGVAQRRRRVFVVGHLGDWHRAAAVLFERHSLSGHPAPSRQTRKGTAGGVAPGATASGWPAEVSPTLNAYFGSKQGLEDQHIAGGGDCLSPLVAMCLITKTRLDSETETLIPTIGGGFNVAQPIGFHHNAQACQLPTAERDTSVSDALTCLQQAAVAYAKTHKPMSETDPKGWSPTESSPTITSWPRDRSDTGTDVAVLQPAMQVRRLTPVECERLQGFPDGYTNIPWRGKPESPDGPRYKALGNSMAVPVMSWIGERINKVEAL
jgi:DNA (cytosine-5)-methyltransferase 1